MQIVTLDSPHHDILKSPAKSVKFPLNTKEKLFIKELYKFFDSLASPFSKPAGLAAPQVGLSQQIIIMQIPPEAKEIRKDVFDILPTTVWINPTYQPVQKDGKCKDWEACYSVSNKMGEVDRYFSVEYQAFTPEGNKIQGLAKGFLARLIQHEVGHLNGELYIDLLCPDCRCGLMDEMMQIRKQEMKK